jgi:hypothetical protein
MCSLTYMDSCFNCIIKSQKLVDLGIVIPPIKGMNHHFLLNDHCIPLIQIKDRNIDDVIALFDLVPCLPLHLHPHFLPICAEMDPAVEICTQDGDPFQGLKHFFGGKALEIP